MAELRRPHHASLIGAESSKYLKEAVGNITSSEAESNPPPHQPLRQGV